MDAKPLHEESRTTLQRKALGNAAHTACAARLRKAP